MRYLIRYELFASLEHALAALLAVALLWSRAAGLFELPVAASGSPALAVAAGCCLAFAAAYPLACFLLLRCEAPLQDGERGAGRADSAEAPWSRMQSAPRLARAVGQCARAAFACSLAAMFGAFFAVLCVCFGLKRLFVMGCLRYRGWHHFFTDCLVCVVLLPLWLLAVPGLPAQVYVLGCFLPALVSAKDSWELAIVERYLRLAPAQKLLEPLHLLFNVQVTVLAASTAVCWLLRDWLDRRRAGTARSRQSAASSRYLEDPQADKRD